MQTMDQLDLMLECTYESLKEEIVEKLIEQAAKDFTEALKPLVEKEMEELTLAKIEKWHDIQAMSDKIGMVHQWRIK